MSRPFLLPPLAVTAVLAVVAVGTPARAATTGIALVHSGTTVAFTAGAKKTNKVTVTRSGRTVTIDDVVTIKAGAGCQRVGRDVTKVRCTTPRTTAYVSVSLKDRNDSVVNKSNLGMHGYGGTGNDSITGGSAADLLEGHTGNDKLYGKGGDDNLTGGAGNDRLDGGAADDSLTGGTGADTHIGGTGTDLANYWDHQARVTVDLDGRVGDDGQRGEKDTVGADVEQIRGGDSGDLLIGNGNPNFINGKSGPDVIRGGGGDDVLWGTDGDDAVFGEAGNDLLRGNGEPWPDTDSEQDLLDGGTDAPGVPDPGVGDRCTIGAAGRAVNCETVD
jgi:Ca2+-binding RTX toxin-like protein